MERTGPVARRVASGSFHRPREGSRDAWQAGGVRYREFWDLVDEVLGRAHGRVLTAQLRVGGLGDRTADAALADGAEPRDVWHAICDELGIPESQRWGADRRRNAPPRRREA